MIKIGFDAKRVFLNRSGLGNYSRSTVELLARYYPENRYTLFATSPENRVGFDIPQGVEVVTPTTCLGKHAPSIWRSAAMASDIARQGVDIFHGLSNELPLDIRAAKTKSVVSLHDLIFIRYPELYKPIDRLLYGYKYRKSCERADKIIAISEQSKNDLMEFWGIPSDKIAVVCQGCSPIFAERGSNEALAKVRQQYNLPQQFLLSVGTLEPRKNLMLTLHALGEGNIDMPLVACGRWTPYVDEMKAYIAQKGMESQVLFLHDVPTPHLPLLYQLATATVYTSIFEGWGIPLLESMHSGTPVITSRGGVFSESGGDAALYVEQQNVAEMIATLQQLLGDSELQQQLIEQGYTHVQQFSEEKIAQNMMQVYQSML